MFLLSSADFFSKLTFSKNSLKNSIRVSDNLDPDQDRHSVGPDLDLNFLQKLSAFISHPLAMKELRVVIFSVCWLPYVKLIRVCTDCLCFFSQATSVEHLP